MENPEVFTLATMANSNPEAWGFVKATLAEDLVEKVEAQVEKMELAKQYSKITPFFIDKSTRPENYAEMVAEFLECSNRAAHLARAIFVEKQFKTPGRSGDVASVDVGRKLKLEVGNETLKFELVRKVETLVDMANLNTKDKLAGSDPDDQDFESLLAQSIEEVNTND